MTTKVHCSNFFYEAMWKHASATPQEPFGNTSILLNTTPQNPTALEISLYISDTSSQETPPSKSHHIVKGRQQYMFEHTHYACIQVD